LTAGGARDEHGGRLILGHLEVFMNAVLHRHNSTRRTPGHNSER
jgi:hypothetical protein